MKRHGCHDNPFHHREIDFDFSKKLKHEINFSTLTSRFFLEKTRFSDFFCPFVTLQKSSGWFSKRQKKSFFLIIFYFREATNIQNCALFFVFFVKFAFFLCKVHCTKIQKMTKKSFFFMFFFTILKKHKRKWQSNRNKDNRKSPKKRYFSHVILATNSTFHREGWGFVKVRQLPGHLL